jgi:hypothetical protein
MERAVPERIYAQIMQLDPQRLDKNLPVWARRAHPILRQQLGVFWRAITPDLSLPLRLFLYQCVAVLLTFAMPGLFALLLPIVAVPVVLLPAVLYFYLETLLRIGAEAASRIAEARRSGHLELLRTTPLSLYEILAAKGAAAVWRQIELLEILLFAAALLSLPVVILQHVNLYSPLLYPVPVRVMMILGFAVSLLRILIEPVMLAALGVLMGTLIQQRITAMLATGALAFAYFVLINLPRLLPLDVPQRFVIEMLLPLVLPAIISFAALRLAVWRIERER